MGAVITIDSKGEAQVSEPAPDRLCSGQPVQRSWNAFSDAAGRFHAGVWASTRGSWRVRYTEDELCHLLEGVVVLHPDNGPPLRFEAGDSFLICSGFCGIWEVVHDCRKLYAIHQH